MSEKASYFNERLGCHSERPEGAKNLEFLDGYCEILRRFAPQNDRRARTSVSSRSAG